MTTSRTSARRSPRRRNAPEASAKTTAPTLLLVHSSDHIEHPWRLDDVTCERGLNEVRKAKELLAEARARREAQASHPSVRRVELARPVAAPEMPPAHSEAS